MGTFDTFKSLHSNNLPEAPSTIRGKSSTAPTVGGGSKSGSKVNGARLAAIRRNMASRGEDAVLDSLLKSTDPDQARLLLEQAKAMHPLAIQRVRQSTKHPTIDASPSSRSYADSLQFQKNYNSDRRRDSTIGAMSQYPGSAGVISDLFKMGGGSFNPRRQSQTNPFYSPSSNQGAAMMGGGSKRSAEELALDWQENHPNDPRPFADFNSIRVR